MKQNQDKNIEDILEIIQFLKDNMVSRGDFDIEMAEVKSDVRFLRENMVSRDDMDARLTEVKSDIMNHMDGFIGLHQKLDIELTALRSKYERLESYIQQLARHAQLELG